jgi:hypothetical protein
MINPFSEDNGIIPRVITQIFSTIDNYSNRDPTNKFSVTCSFLQIYNENIYDLFESEVIFKI